jgi:uncharacterized protein
MTTTARPPAPTPADATRSRWLPRDERSLFLLGTALVALHVLDGTLVQPPAGTTAADHSLSAMVPTVLIAAAMWCFGRVRAGWRAVLALSVGVFGIGIGAIEAGYYTTSVGPSGDDFTGLVAIFAGALLVGLGLWRLWRSRRRTGRLWRRLVRRSMLVVVAALAAFFVAQPVLFAYAVTHVQRAVVPEDELGVAHEEVTFTTSDGLTLHGWYIPSRNGAALVDFPGRSGPQKPARFLAKHGYGVLLFDRRGEGESEGEPNAWGWGGEADIKAAVAYLQTRSDVDPDRIGGIGLSVGGELMLEAAAKDADLAAVVSDGAGARHFREEKEALPGPGFWAMSPAFALLNASVAVFSDTAPPESLFDLVPRIAPRPLLFIYAPDGGNATEVLTPDYARIAGPTASLWTVPDAPHIKAIETAPAEYERRVIGFFDDALLNR